MNTLQVCDRWPLPLLPGLTGGHFSWIDTASKRNNDCFLKLLDGVKADSVVEYFGGVGAFSRILQEVVHPSSHRVFDISKDCVQQLQSLGLAASVGDAKATMGTVSAQLVVLDFPVATARTHHEWPWERVIALKPDVIIFSDTAKRRIGLHRALYSAFFGVPIVSHRDYVATYSRWLWERYGYGVTMESSHVYTYCRMEPMAQFVELHG